MIATIGIIIFMWLPASVVLIRNIFAHTYTWQIKEYRVDRMVSQLRYEEVKSTKGVILNTIQILLLVSILLAFIFPNNIFVIIPALVFVSYIVEAIFTAENFLKKNFIRPKKSIRNLLILAFSTIVLFAPIILPINFTRNLYSNQDFAKAEETIQSEPVSFEDFLLQEDIQTQNNGIPLAIALTFITSTLLLVTDLISPFVVSFFAIITEPLAQYKRTKTIQKAKSKVSKHRGFKVVAITGSYGKTTTKEILYELIQDNLKTAITDKNFNSSVGVAESILRNLKPETEVFIAEMGAYRKGEIKKSTDILEPDISIVTGLVEQHLSLFGSFEKLFNAKYEIILGLKPNGLAIINGSNRHSVLMQSKTQKRTLVYQIIDSDSNKIKTLKNQKTQDQTISGNLFALNLKETDHGLEFDLKFNTFNYPVKTNLKGLHNAQNLLASIGAALELGIDPKSIVAKINTTKFSQIYQKEYDGLNEARIIDDSYNSNPEGFKKAIEYLRRFEGRKIVITQGIIELGPAKKKIYEEIGNQLETIDLTISTDQKLLKNIKQKNKKVFAKNTKDLLEKIYANVKENDIVLAEGSLPPSVIKTLIEPNSK